MTAHVYGMIQINTYHTDQSTPFVLMALLRARAPESLQEEDDDNNNDDDDRRVMLSPGPRVALLDDGAQCAISAK